MNDETVTQPVQPAPVPPPMPPVAEPVPAPVPPPAPARREPRRRFGCSGVLIGILIVLAVLLGVAVLVVAVAGSGERTPWRAGTGAARIKEILVAAAKEDTPGKIVVIDVKGLIMSDIGRNGTDPARFAMELQKAADDPHVVAVLLDMDTPGGEVTASDEIYHSLRAFRNSSTAKARPVVACMRSVCASGGYYIAAGADHIVANELTLTGSIGVIVPKFKYTQLLDKVGIQLDSVKSGAMKDMLSGGVSRPPEEDARVNAYVQSLVDETFYRFLTVVAEGRRVFANAEDVKRREFADGRVMLGSQALMVGLVDQCGYFEDAVAKAKEMAGVGDANIIRYQQEFSLRDLLFSMQGGQRMKLETSLDRALPPLKPAAFYYLMPGLVE